MSVEPPDVPDDVNAIGEIPVDAVILDELRIVRYVSDESPDPIVYIEYGKESSIYDLFAMMGIAHAQLIDSANCQQGE